MFWEEQVRRGAGEVAAVAEEVTLEQVEEAVHRGAMRRPVCPSRQPPSLAGLQAEENLRT